MTEKISNHQTLKLKRTSLSLLHPQVGRDLKGLEPQGQHARTYQLQNGKEAERLHLQRGREAEMLQPLPQLGREAVRPQPQQGRKAQRGLQREPGNAIKLCRKELRGALWMDSKR
ncbi:hypothetical protein ISCGN_031920 [Ixodes scapularis]